MVCAPPQVLNLSKFAWSFLPTFVPVSSLKPFPICLAHEGLPPWWALMSALHCLSACSGCLARPLDGKLSKGRYLGTGLGPFIRVWAGLAHAGLQHRLLKKWHSVVCRDDLFFTFIVVCFLYNTKGYQLARHLRMMKKQQIVYKGFHVRLRVYIILNL